MTSKIGRSIAASVLCSSLLSSPPYDSTQTMHTDLSSFVVKINTLYQPTLGETNTTQQQYEIQFHDVPERKYNPQPAALALLGLSGMVGAYRRREKQ